MIQTLNKDKREPYTIETSIGLRDLLERNNIKPTGDSKKDIKLAQKIMPKPYKG